MYQLLHTLRSLEPARLAAVVAVTSAVLGFFLWLSLRIAAPDMSLLYGTLSAEDSRAIESRFQNMGQHFELSGDGSAISVPQERVDDLRVALASEGLPSGATVGYEIFDRAGLGGGDFLQSISHLRALEGELSRTIGSIGEIAQARVHLVLPKGQLFHGESQAPSASIVVSAAGLSPLAAQQVAAIQHLVATAVPGLRPQMISVVDQRGNLLARGDGDESLSAAASRSEEQRIAYERRLARSIEELLTPTLGFGNVRAQVAADLDFDQVTENAETYDPDSQVVRSSQSVEEINSAEGNNAASESRPAFGLPVADSGSREAERTEEAVTYELSRTTRTQVRQAGELRRLSVAVMVNGSNAVGEDGNRLYTPRSSAEMAQIENLVRSAIGLDESRGDRLEVVNLPFTDLSVGVKPEESVGFAGLGSSELLRLAELAALSLLALAVIFFVVRPLVGRGLARLQASPGGVLSHETVGDLPTPQGIGGVSEEFHEQALHSHSGAQRVSEAIRSHPEAAVSILRSWLHKKA